MLPLLEIKGLSVNFRSGESTTPAVRNVSFNVRQGETIAVVGESGSGKSVTALSILRLLPSPPAQYVSGQILFSTTASTQLDMLGATSRELREIRGNQIAMIFQEPMSSLNPVFSCGNQVSEALLQHKNVSRTKAQELTKAWFEKVKLPDPTRIARSYPHQLSGGQKQRVMIAMAMCCNPSLLICDEPTTALDVTVQKSILALIKELQQEQNIGVIFITHDLGVVGEIADKAVVMYKGEIVEQAQTSEIFKNPAHPYTKGLLACRPALHSKGERLPVVTDFIDQKDFGQTQMIPAGITPQRLNSKTEKPSLVSVKELSVWFPSRKNVFGKPLDYIKAVDDVSFSIFEGETLGLVGESGCGKTTLGRVLLRLIEPTAGKIIYNGIDLAEKKRTELVSMRKSMQIVFQDPYSSLNPRITIGSAVEEVLKVHEPRLPKKQRREKMMEMLKKVNLEHSHSRRYPHEFSGGQRQRIVIARALVLNPSFIVCDESVSALDVSVQAQVLNLLNDLKKEFGFTTVFISHDLSVVRYISDRIMVMNKGKIVETGDAETVYRHPVSSYTRMLIDSIPATG